MFDNVKLNDVSKEVISRMNSDEVLKAVLDWAKKYNEEVYNLISKDEAYSKKIFALERDGAKKYVKIYINGKILYLLSFISLMSILKKI